MVSSSDRLTVLIPVTVSILVPVDVDPSLAPSDVVPGAIGDIDGATVAPDSPLACAALQAALESSEVLDAFERQAAAFAIHRQQYPATRARATLALGLIPDEEL